MNPEARDVSSEAAPSTDRVTPVLDAYRMERPVLGSDMTTRLDNDRYMTRLGFTGAERLLGPDAFVARTSDSSASVSPDSVVRRTPGTHGADPVKPSDPVKLSDQEFAACVDKHAGTSPRPFTLVVDLAGVDKSLKSTTFPVAAGDRAGDRTFATTAHGLVRMRGESSATEHQLLDYGFKSRDSNNDGVLSREEVAESLKREQERDKSIADKSPNPNEPDPMPSVTGQVKYVEDNYDSILASSRRLDPNASGITNEGLAQHYLENARARLQTPCGDIPLEVAAGDRGVDVAILRATGLSEAQQRLVGKDYVLADGLPRMGESIIASGYPAKIESSGTGTPSFEVSGRAVGFATSPLSGGPVVATDAWTAAGMSGGPVTSAESGRVVGLVHGTIMPPGSTSMKSIFPAIVHSGVIRDLIDRGRMRRH